MTILHVRHKTTYRYRRPVQFGEHRLMCRPRDSHDLRLIDTALLIDPAPSSVRWLHDVFGNSIALVNFARPGMQLVFESGFRAEHFPAPPQAIELESSATRLPLSYSVDEAFDLGRTRDRHYADPEQRIDGWSRAIVERTPAAATLEVLADMTRSIKAQFRYLARDAVGVQSPLETLALGTGSCRDFAVFMMEAARSVGLAARFVSGYLYDERLIGAGSGLVGLGATHAWLQVYLQGAGWVEFDPTNALVGGRNLIRVAVARDASQAAPLVGSFNGLPSDSLDMRVEVQVTTE